MMKKLLPALLLWTSAAFGAELELVVLTGTGERREELPVLTRHPDESAVKKALSAGFPARVIRLYHLVQRFRSARDGVPLEPAYLYLSDNQGGFPRYGFFLDGVKKPDVAYVDLHRSSAITGRYGAVDQIFPHELGHVFIRHLIGQLGDGGANQIHATGLRTDRVVAFNEGFAEHFQVMTLEDPEAPPETARLKADEEARSEAAERLRLYRRALEARWSPGAPARMRFLFWFSATEDVLRHHWVLENAFARQPKMDPRLPSRDLYAAYLLDGIFPGEPDGSPKSAGILAATEGVVSALFHRWVTDPEIQRHRAEAGFFERFGTQSEQVSPLENAYLKLFFVFSAEKPQDVIAAVNAYRRAFPEDAAALERIVAKVFLGQDLPTAPEIWLANSGFKTGTTLFDQYRGLPRTHTFDLNAASLVDLMGVPGMNRPTAERIQRAAPFADLGQVGQVEGVQPPLLATLRRMADAMESLRASQEEQEADLSLESILTPYAKRALLILGLCWLAAAALYRTVRKTSWWRAVLNGFAASLLLLGTAWIIDGWAGWRSFSTPLVILAAPAAVWQLVRRRNAGAAWRVLAAWLAACLPAASAIQTWL